MVKVEDDNEFIGYARKDDPKKTIFYITFPFDGGKASFGNGTMVAFKVLSQQIVDKVHELAIKNGGINEGDRLLEILFIVILIGRETLSFKLFNVFLLLTISSSLKIQHNLIHIIIYSF